MVEPTGTPSSTVHTRRWNGVPRTSNARSRPTAGVSMNRRSFCAMIEKLRSAEAWLTPFLALNLKWKLVHGAMCSDRKNRRNSADACERGCAEMQNHTGRHGDLHVALLQRRPPR